MEDIEKFYGKKIFALYALFMAVPGTNSCYRKIFVTFSVLVLSFSTIFQVLKFVTDGFTLKLIVELVPTTVAISGCLLYILYMTLAIQGQLQFEKLMSVIEKDLKEERTAEEDEIKRQFAVSAKFLTNVYAGVLVITVCGMPFTGFLPHILDVLMSVNDTRPPELLFNGEIFIDIRKYFYYIYFVECCTVMIGGLVIIISENMSIIIVQHACGMLAVLGYQLENLDKIKDKDTSLDGEETDDENLLTKRLQTCIKDHQIILRFLFIAAEFYDIPVTLILIGCFCTLTTSLVQVTDPQLVSMKILIFTFTQFCQLFLMSYMGQVWMDASLRVAQSAYNAKWVSFPTSARKLLQMMILRSSKPCMVLARGIYVLSVENCMAVVQTIISFYMVVRQSH